MAYPRRSEGLSLKAPPWPTQEWTEMNGVLGTSYKSCLYRQRQAAERTAPSPGVGGSALGHGLHVLAEDGPVRPSVYSDP